jgi:site-specific recombinase XerD
MKPTDFSKNLSDFLTRYLPGERGASHNTILSYKDTFLLFIVFMRDQKGIKAEKLDMNVINKTCIVEFLNWLEKVRHCSVSTRNARLAGLHSFFRYLLYDNPLKLNDWQQILSIPVKKTEKASMNYLSLDGIKLLLASPDLSAKRGRRDLALLSLTYDSGARVSEIINLTPAMIRFDKPCTIRLIGKGNKERIVPLMDIQVAFLRDYMSENKLLYPYANQYPLFYNSRREKLTRAGVNYILMKYINQAKKENPAFFSERLSIHSLRHSKAFHLLQAGVNLVYIRDILGHRSIKTTEIYARVDSQKKREAIAGAHKQVLPKNIPPWLVNDNLLTWLKQFK